MKAKSHAKTPACTASGSDAGVRLDMRKPKNRISQKITKDTKVEFKKNPLTQLLSLRPSVGSLLFAFLAFFCGYFESDNLRRRML
jgi:hypothetical protein